MKRTHINAATTDGGLRRKLYGEAAEKAGQTLNAWILTAGDQRLPKAAQRKLKPLKGKKA